MKVDLFGRTVDIPEELILAEREFRDPKNAVLYGDVWVTEVQKSICSSCVLRCSECFLSRAHVGMDCRELVHKIVGTNRLMFLCGCLTMSWSKSRDRKARQQLQKICDFIDDILKKND